MSIGPSQSAILTPTVCQPVEQVTCYNIFVVKISLFVFFLVTFDFTLESFGTNSYLFLELNGEQSVCNESIVLLSLAGSEDSFNGEIKLIIHTWIVTNHLTALCLLQEQEIQFLQWKQVVEIWSPLPNLTYQSGKLHSMLTLENPFQDRFRIDQKLKQTVTRVWELSSCFYQWGCNMIHVYQLQCNSPLVDVIKGFWYKV